MKQGAVTNIVLIDDHELVRCGLKTFLQSQLDMKVVGEASTLTDGVSIVERLTPHLVLLDVKLPDASIAEACRRLLAVVPTLRILVLTGFGEQATVRVAIQQGAHGFALKDIKMDELVCAIRTVASGHGYLDPRVSQQALHWFRTSSHSTMTTRGITRLTPRERLVLPLPVEGKTPKEIATQLQVSDKTVKNYLASIFEKLQVKRRAEAVAWFMKETHMPIDLGSQGDVEQLEEGDER